MKTMVTEKDQGLLRVETQMLIDEVGTLQAIETLRVAERAARHRRQPYLIAKLSFMIAVLKGRV